VRLRTAKRLKSTFWGLALASGLASILIISVLQINPAHLSPEYPESIRVDGFVWYVTVLQKRAIEILFLAFFVSAVGIRLEEMTKKNALNSNDDLKAG
jgi:hypothetical protein